MTFPSNATWLDMVIVLAYLALIMWIGIWFAKRQRTMKEYFLAGQNMGWLPVGLSLMGAIHSGIHYIQAPSAANKYGPIFLIQVTSWLIVYPWAMWVVLPFYRRLGNFTCYEYLEQRFGRGARRLAAVVFLLWRLGWVGTALYTPALAVYAVSGGRISIELMVIVLGVVVAFSTMLGGMRGVIWTDVFQFLIMIGGLGMTLFMIMWNIPGGVSSILSQAHAAGKLSLFASIPPEFRGNALNQAKWLFTAETSGIGITMAAFVGRLANYSTDQVMIQRFQTTKSLKDARQALLVNAISDVIWFMVLIFVGLALFVYYKSVKTLPPGIKPDFIFPYFMSTIFPSGAIGLVVATIFAASLAAIGSAINSCTSVSIVDLYQFKPAMEGASSSEQRRVEVKSLAVSRWLTLAFGAFGTIIATQLARLGDLIKISNLVIQTFTGPLLGIYLLGMFTRRAHQFGVLVGGAIGTALAISLAFVWPIGFIWPTIYGLFATLVSGYVFSILTPMLRKDGDELTWRRVMSRSMPKTVGADATTSQGDPALAAVKG